MATLAEKWFSEGIETGINELRTILQKQLILRFGLDILPKSVNQRIESASKDQLETWALKIFDAKSIEVYCRQTGQDS